MRSYAQQKAALTRATKRGYDAVLAECKRVIAEWEQLPYGWPDDWHRWNIALEDAWQDARFDRERQTPPYVSFEDLRWQR